MHQGIGKETYGERSMALKYQKQYACSLFKLGNEFNMGNPT